jgi:hypothetical protein
MVGGKASTAAAKMTGMTPAMLTRSGRYVEPPDVIRRPTIRFAYWIGILRWPSWTKTTEATMASATSGKKIRSIGPPFHQAVTPSGRLVRIDAKMRIEMPFPMPRFVICSPMHMSRHAADRERDDDQDHAARVRLKDPLVLEQERVAERLSGREGHGQIPRVLG